MSIIVRTIPRFPVVCMDETSKQLVREVRPALAPEPGRAERHDYEYQRNGVANLFLAFEPLAGWRCVDVTENRARRDWALFLVSLLEHRYHNAERVTVVLDNLNTHSGASFYENLSTAGGTPLARACGVRPPRRSTGVGSTWPRGSSAFCNASASTDASPNPETLQREVNAWQQHRNASAVGANWQFTTEGARIKLGRLYPSFEE